jgi:Leucine-rich repeat (LRR) protein
MKSILIFFIAFIGIHLNCQVRFDSRDPQLFKYYGSPMTEVLVTPESVLKTAKPIKIRLENVPIEKYLKQFSRWQHLEILWLHNNQISSLPPAISQSNELIILVSSGNPLRTLPETWECKSLMYLELQNTNLTSISVKENQWVRLELLRIFNNESDSLVFPENISILPSLRSIQLVNVKLNQFPEFLHRCKGIEEIILSKCGLTEIPDSLFNFPNLKRLNLSGNSLTQFPAGLLKSKKIQSIELQGNKIKEVPEKIIYLPDLEYLDIRNNPVPEDDLGILSILLSRKAVFKR